MVKKEMHLESLGWLRFYGSLSQLMTGITCSRTRGKVDTVSFHFLIQIKTEILTASYHKMIRSCSGNYLRGHCTMLPQSLWPVPFTGEHLQQQLQQFVISVLVMVIVIFKTILICHIPSSVISKMFIVEFFLRFNIILVFKFFLNFLSSGMADIIGRRFGSQKLPYNQNKSIVGSITMAVSGFLASIG